MLRVIHLPHLKSLYLQVDELEKQQGHIDPIYLAARAGHFLWLFDRRREPLQQYIFL